MAKRSQHRRQSSTTSLSSVKKMVGCFRSSSENGLHEPALPAVSVPLDRASQQSTRASIPPSRTHSLSSKSLLGRFGSSRQSNRTDAVLKETAGTRDRAGDTARGSVESRDFATLPSRPVGNDPASTTVRQTVREKAPSIGKETDIGAISNQRRESVARLSSPLIWSKATEAALPVTPEKHSKRRSKRASSSQALTLSSISSSPSPQPTNISVQAKGSTESPCPDNEVKRITAVGANERSGIDTSSHLQRRSIVLGVSSDQMRAFLGDGRSYDPYPGFKRDKWLLSPSGDCYVHLENDNVPTFRLDSAVLRKLPFLCELLEQSRSAARPLLDLDVLRQPRPGSLPLHQRISPLKLEGIADYNSSPDITSGLAMPESATLRIWTPRSLNDLFVEGKTDLVFRNILALLYDAPLVGTSMVNLTSSLRDLAEALDYLVSLADEKQFPHACSTSSNLLTQYVRNMGYIDVANDLKHAIDMLIWCELPCVQWTEGYRECFAQVTGMMSAADWTDFSISYANNNVVSPATSAMLFKGWSQLRLKVSHAEYYLRHFQFSELLDFLPKGYDGVRTAFGDFSRVVKEHYTSQYMWWPPNDSDRMSKLWLTWELVQRLTSDFNELYDALVDEDVSWNRLTSTHEGVETDHPRYFMRSRTIPEDGKPEETVLVWRTMATALRRFDAHREDETMPLPCPLMPHRGILDDESENSPLRRSTRRQERFNGSDHKPTALIFRGATRQSSLDQCDKSVGNSTLLQKLVRLEATAVYPTLSIEALQDARLGRWLLIYGVLQLLSTLSAVPDYGALKEARSAQESSERSYFLWGALCPNPPWLQRSYSDVQMSGRSTGAHPPAVSVSDADVLDYQRARQASHPWRRYADLRSKRWVQTSELEPRSPPPKFVLPPLDQLTPRPASEYFGRRISSLPVRPSSAYITNSPSRFSGHRMSPFKAKPLSEKQDDSSSIFGALPDLTAPDADKEVFGGMPDPVKKRGHGHTLSTETWQTIDTADKGDDGGSGLADNDDDDDDDEVTMTIGPAKHGHSYATSNATWETIEAESKDEKEELNSESSTPLLDRSDDLEERAKCRNERHKLQQDGIWPQWDAKMDEY